MSAQHYAIDQDKRLPLFCSTINSLPANKLIVDCAARSFVATPATPIADFPVQGMYYQGSTLLGVPTAINFYFAVLGGVLGAATVAIKSANLGTTYYSAVVPVSGVNVVALTLSAALPVGAAPLVLVISSDATCNSTIEPLSLVFTY